jgi:hypothetical protein
MNIERVDKEASEIGWILGGTGSYDLAHGSQVGGAGQVSHLARESPRRADLFCEHRREYDTGGLKRVKKKERR